MLIFFQKGAFQSSKVLRQGFKTRLIISLLPRLPFSLSLSIYICMYICRHNHLHLLGCLWLEFKDETVNGVNYQEKIITGCQ